MGSKFLTAFIFNVLFYLLPLSHKIDATLRFKTENVLFVVHATLLNDHSNIDSLQALLRDTVEELGSGRTDFC